MLDENLVASMVTRRVVGDTFRRLPPDKKWRIYQAALRLFGRYGYDGLPVARLCRQAAISKGSFFQYFPSKSHLLEFCLLVFDDRLERLFDDIRRRETAGTVRQRLAYLCTAVTASDLSPDERLFYLLAVWGLRHSGVETAGIDLERHFRAGVREIVLRGIETGEVRGDYPGAVLAEAVAAVLSGLLSRVFAVPDEDPGPLSETVLAVVLDGLLR